MTKLLLASTCLVSLLGGAALADDASKMKKPAPAAKPITVKLNDAKGKSVGTAKLSADPGGVKITLALKGLSPGEHAIHVHETAKCDAPDFKSAGGHFNPEHKQHGSANPEGSHAGDMPNFTADDMKTDPAGAAGDRVACGVIKK